MFSYEIKKLQRLKNPAAQLITRTKKSEQITTIHWLQVQERIIFKALLNAYRTLHGMAPDYLSKLLTIYRPVCLSLPQVSTICPFLNQELSSTAIDHLRLLNLSYETIFRRQLNYLSLEFF